MGQVNPTIECAKCGKKAVRAYHWRQKDYCSVACRKTAIEARNQRVAVLAAEKKDPEVEA